MNWYPARVGRLHEWGEKPLAGYGLMLGLWDYAFDIGGLPNDRKKVAALTGYTEKQMEMCWEPFVAACNVMENGRLIPTEILEYHAKTANTRIRDIKDWRIIRLTVLERDRRACFYCSSDANTVDHLMPYIKGGSAAIENLVTACRRCNSQKNDRTLQEYLDWLFDNGLLDKAQALAQRIEQTWDYGVPW